ncbi:MAG: glycoside hydrolase family 38 C-terminal domain-containing protein [Monoglobales bacterium]
MKKFFMVGNTHFDPVWLWKWEEAMASIRATFRSALDRMNETKVFIYSFATPPVFDWIKKTDAKLFEEIKERVKEGRWDLAEGWWIQPDCYSGCAESYVRQGLYGQRYLKENFGRISNVVFNIDSFGHSPQLPQILKKSGIEYYCFVRPESRHIELEKPYFKWRGIDGSTVLGYRVETAYQPDVNDTAKKLEHLSGDNQMIVYGVTDHGGAPTKKSIADIIESPNMKFSTVENFFKAQGDTDYVVEKELLTGDFGPYSNGIEIKKLNSIAETAVLNAEKSSVIAGVNDKAVLTECWKDIMFNQFHDILGGATTKEAVDDARHLYGRAITTANYIMHTNLQKVTANIKMPGKNPDNPWNIVVWNLNGFDYTGYVEAEVQWAHEFPFYRGGISLEDCDGNRYDTQIITEKSVIPGFRSRFVFKAHIPAMGYKTFKVILDELPAEYEKINPYEIETDLYRFVISKETGAIVRIINKGTGKESDNPVFTPNCYADDGDTWAFNIEEYGGILGGFKVCEIKVIENGLHRIKVKITSEFARSVLVTYYTFYRKENYVDVKYKVNWNEAHIALKLDISAEIDGIRVGVPGGSILRKDTKGDEPLNKWMSFGGMSILTDSIFAYSADDEKVGLTLLRSPIYGDLRIEPIDLGDDYDIMEQGITEGRIRLILDENADAQKESELFVNECIVIDEANHDGEAKGVGNFLSIDGNGVSLMALKYAEDSDAVILRLAEYLGKKTSGNLIFRNDEFEFNMEAFEIKTFKILSGKIFEVNMLEE